MNENDWRRWAACKGHYGIFFPEQAVNVKTKASNLCASCPVRKACLNHALTRPETHGYWGGKSERDRRKLRKEMRKKKAA